MSKPFTLAGIDTLSSDCIGACLSFANHELERINALPTLPEEMAEEWRDVLRNLGARPNPIQSNQTLTGERASVPEHEAENIGVHSKADAGAPDPTKVTRTAAVLVGDGDETSDQIERVLEDYRESRWEKLSVQHQWLSEAFQLLEESRSVPMQRAIRLLRQVADTRLWVLLEGESGVGKEVVARFLHARSGRAHAPFVPIYLAAVPSTLLESQLFGHVKGAFTGAEREWVGKFELANGGTLFLDEIDELDARAQLKLLRVLQERKVERIGAREPSLVDVRVIAATNKNLHDQVAKGQFREDLYYRLNVMLVTLPPLRERIEDLPALIDLLCAKHAAIIGGEPPRFTDEALSVLRHYEWPGNVRELENLVMRLVAVAPGQDIMADDIAPVYCPATLQKMAGQMAEQQMAEQQMAERMFKDFPELERFERYLVRMMPD